MTNQAELLERQPPFDLEAETSLVGSMLVDPRVIDDVSLVVTEGDFYDDSNGILFGTMRIMAAEGVGIDTTTLMGRLKDDHNLDRVGGSAALARILTAVPHAAHAAYYAKSVRSKAIRRDVIDLASQTIQDAFNGDRESSDLAAVLSDKLLAIGERDVASRPINARDLLHTAIEEIDARLARKGGTGVQTGLADLDELIGGFRPGEMTIVGGRPSMGKSALLLNMAEAAALDELSVMVVSLEMSHIEYADRLLSSLAKVNSFKMRSGCISKDERVKIIEAASKLSQTRMHVIDDPNLSVAKIANHARIMKRRNGLDVVFIDYVQIIEPTDRRLPRQEQVAGIGRDLKRLARTLSVPVVVACQLNKESGNQPPELHHLRESDALSHEADVVMFVYRPEYYFPDNEEHKGVGHVLVRKQRMGPVGAVKTVWRKDFTRFDSLSARDMHNYVDFNND